MNVTINTENTHTYNKLKLYIITHKYLINNYININKNEHNKYLCHICSSVRKSPRSPMILSMIYKIEYILYICKSLL